MTNHDNATRENVLVHSKIALFFYERNLVHVFPDVNVCSAYSIRLFLSSEAKKSDAKRHLVNVSASSTSAHGLSFLSHLFAISLLSNYDAFDEVTTFIMSKLTTFPENYITL